MAYPFIELEKSATTKLIAHLAKQCGVEKETDTPRADLVSAIIEFEELNNLSRPIDLLPADLRPTVVIEASAELPKKLEVPIRKHPKVTIRINEDASANGTGDVYVRVNEYEALIKRNVDVDIPRPVYQMLTNAIEIKGLQNKDGTIDYRSVPSYNVTYLGEAD